MEVKGRNIINVLLLLLGFTLFQVGSSSTEGPVSTLEKFTVPPTTVAPSTSTTKTTTTTTKTTTNGSRTTKAAEKDYVGVGVGVAVGGFFVLVAAILLICYFFCSPSVFKFQSICSIIIKCSIEICSYEIFFKNLSRY